MKRKIDEDYFDEAAFLTMGDGKGPEEDGKDGEEAKDDGVQ